MIITDIINKKSQSSIYVNGELYCNLNNNIVAQHDLKSGQEIDEETLNNLLFDSDFEQAKKKAFCFLERRNYSRFELTNKLKKDFDENVVFKVVDKVEDLGFINDENVAKSFAQELLESKGYSKYRAKLELLKKGFSKELVSDILDEFEVDEESVIKELVEKKYKSAFEDEKIKRRAIAFLQRQGYSFEAIKRVLWQNDF